MTRNAMLRDIFYLLWTNKEYHKLFESVWFVELTKLHSGRSSEISDETLQKIMSWSEKYRK